MSNSKEFFPLSPFILNITQLKCLPFTLTLAQTHILEHFSFLYSHAHKLSHGNCPPPCQSDSICCCDPGLGSSEALHLPSSQTLISLSTLPTLPPILSGLFSHHATLPAWKSSFGLFFFLILAICILISVSVLGCCHSCKPSGTKLEGIR